MSDRVNRSVSAPGVVQGFRAEPSSTTERKGSFVTVETVVLWLVYAFMIAGNAFVEATQFADTTSASVAYSTFTWFTPAGYVFSIWSVIYVALFIWLVAYTRRAAKRSPGFTPMSVLFIVSSGLNVLWLVIWHLQMLELALVIIAVMWVVLAALYLQVRKANSSLVAWVPISLYTGWITVATIANLAIVITRAFNGSTDFLNGLSVVLLTAGVLTLGYLAKQRLNDGIVPLVFLWAIVGVGVHVLEVSNTLAMVVFALAFVGAVLIFAPLGKLRSKASQ